MDTLRCIALRHSYRGAYRNEPVPQDMDLVCILPLGRADGEPVPPRKKAFEERAFFNRFG